MLDRGQVTRVAGVVTYLSACGRNVPLRAQTITKLLRARDDRDLSLIVELSDAVQTIEQDAELGLKLLRIRHLLKVTPAAAADIWTWRSYARRRGFRDRLDVGKRYLALHL